MFAVGTSNGLYVVNMDDGNELLHLFKDNVVCAMAYLGNE